MHRLSYRSQALATDPAVIDALYAQAAQFNARAGITGALIFIEGRWAQILEGDRAAITDLYGRITRDPRHERVTLDYVIQTPARLFPDWLMGRITDDDKADIPLARIVAATVAADSDTRIRQLRSLAQAAREPLRDTSITDSLDGPAAPARIPLDQGRPPLR
jgi:hypothetical protein